MKHIVLVAQTMMSGLLAALVGFLERIRSPSK